MDVGIFVVRVVGLRVIFPQGIKPLLRWDGYGRAEALPFRVLRTVVDAARVRVLREPGAPVFCGWNFKASWCMRMRWDSSLRSEWHASDVWTLADVFRGKDRFT